MIYIVNPSYRFLKDKNRVILHSVSLVSTKKVDTSDMGTILFTCNTTPCNSS